MESFKRFILDDWINKSISIFIAIILFLIVYLQRIENIEFVREFEIKLPQNLVLSQLPEKTNVFVYLKIRREDAKNFKISNIKLVLDASKITKEGTYTLPIMLINNEPIKILQVNLSLKTIDVTLEPKTEKTVNIIPNIIIKGDETLEIDELTLTPKSVKIYGSKRVLDNINYIYTKEKTLTELDMLISENIELISPNKLITLEDERVLLTISAKSKYKSLELNNIPLIFYNLDPTLKVSLTDSYNFNLSIRSFLSKEEFENITNESFSYFLDFKDIKSEGIYELEVKIINNVIKVEITDFEPKVIRVKAENKIEGESEK